MFLYTAVKHLADFKAELHYCWSNAGRIQEKSVIPACIEHDFLALKTR